MFLAFGQVTVTDELWMLSTSGLSVDSKYVVSGVKIRTFCKYSFSSMTHGIIHTFLLNTRAIISRMLNL